MTNRTGRWLVAGLVAARVISPVPLPELVLAAVFPAVLLLLWIPLRARVARTDYAGGVTPGR